MMLSLPRRRCSRLTIMGTLESIPSVSRPVRILKIHREIVRDLLRKGELKRYKRTFARTLPFVVARDSVLDFDRRRRSQTVPPLAR